MTMNAQDNLIGTLANSPVYRNYERAYGEATGLPLTLRPLETWQLPLHGQKNESPFCALMAEKSRTCSACLQTQEKLALGARDGRCTLTCAYGLCETAVPLKVGGSTVGFLQTGQVMSQKPTQESFQRAAAKAAEFGVDLDHANARAAFFKTPVASEEKIESVATLLEIFAEHLSIKGNQMAIQAANAEPPVIAKAKKYIEEHHAENLSLGQVAQAVHTSVFYFCKLFKKATGLHFTEQVSRVRTEKAKNLLLNPNLRVTEIAYEVGFQSLTHFNRVFKKVVGESPTAYRGHLPKSG